MILRTIPMYKLMGKLYFFKQEDLDEFLMDVCILSQEGTYIEASRYLIGCKRK